MQSSLKYPKNLHETLSLTHFQSILLISSSRHEILPFYLITTYFKFHIPSKRLSTISIMCCWFITLELWMRTIDGFELKSHWIQMRALDTYMLSHAMIFVACSGENCCGKRSLRGPNYYKRPQSSSAQKWDVIIFQLWVEGRVESQHDKNCPRQS